MDPLHLHTNANASRTVPSDLVFDAQVDSPELVAALCTRSPRVETALEQLRKEIPLAPSIDPAHNLGWYRLPGHYRSICVPLADDTSPISLYDSEVIICKGSEPLSCDYAHYLRWMTTAQFRSHDLPMSEHFPLVQIKAPGTLTLVEAFREQRPTTRIQLLHLRHYGELALIPVPLMIHRLSADQNSACVAQLRNHLSRLSFEYIEPRVRGGLGIAIFYYPCAPLRADYFADSAHIRSHMTKIPDASEIIRRWTTLFIRLLYLGYMSFAPWATGRGSCFDPGNAAINGGVFDCDSLVPVDMISDDLHFYRSFLWSLDLLRRSMISVLQLTDNDNEPVFRYLSQSYLIGLVEEAIETEARPGLVLDSRVVDCLHNTRLSSLTNCMKGKPRSAVPYSSEAADTQPDAAFAGA
jgi:hypothetical protein